VRREKTRCRERETEEISERKADLGRLSVPREKKREEKGSRGGREVRGNGFWGLTEGGFVFLKKKPPPLTPPEDLVRGGKYNRTAGKKGGEGLYFERERGKRSPRCRRGIEKKKKKKRGHESKERGGGDALKAKKKKKKGRLRHREKKDGL